MTIGDYVSKGSNIRPANWDRVFGEPNSPERLALLDAFKEEMATMTHEEQLAWVRDVQDRAERVKKSDTKPDMKRDNNGNGSKPDIIQAG